MIQLCHDKYTIDKCVIGLCHQRRHDILTSVIGITVS